MVAIVLLLSIAQPLVQYQNERMEVVVEEVQNSVNEQNLKEKPVLYTSTPL